MRSALCFFVFVAIEISLKSERSTSLSNSKLYNCLRWAHFATCNDPVQAEIRSPNNSELDFIIEFGKMAGSQGNRKNQLSQNSATAMHHTCNGIVCLYRHLLATSHKYVLLRQFSTDPLEKEFGKLRQGAGGTNFINVQHCIEKLHIKQTSLLLNQNVYIWIWC